MKKNEFLFTDIVKSRNITNPAPQTKLFGGILNKNLLHLLKQSTHNVVHAANFGEIADMV